MRTRCTVSWHNRQGLIVYVAKYFSQMGTFSPGDVVLVAVALGKRDAKKVRPAVIVADTGNGSWQACPVSSTPSYDSPSILLDLKDFKEGGLDIMQESYILGGFSLIIRASDIIAKKGRLSDTALGDIISLVSGTPGR